MKSYGFFSVIVVFSLLLVSPWNAYGVYEVVGLEETPLGFYRSIGVRQTQRGGGYGVDKHSLRGITPAKDQSPLGTCSSFAASACCEYYHQKKFSEAEFTVLAQTHKTAGNRCAGGLFLGKALGVAEKYGFVEENRLQYKNYLRQLAIQNHINIQSQNWEQALSKEGTRLCMMGDYNGTMAAMGFPFKLYNNKYKNITQYRIGKNYVIHHVSNNSTLHYLNTYEINEEPYSIGTPGNADIESVKYYLSQNHPVACALNVFSCKNNKGKTISSNWDLSQYENTIRHPSNKEDSVDLHAVVLTGFNDRHSSFTLKNSWGQNWGGQGFAYIPYNYVQLYSTELVAIGNPY